MSSIPRARRSKVSKTSSSSRQIDLDRLSSLPDPIITHILSFLPTKYAARTSVLSTRWKYIFLSVSKLVFDDPGLLSPRVKRGRKLDFIEFVNRRLMLSKAPSITEFRLECQKLPEASVINLWLTTLLFRNLEILEIAEQFSAEVNSPSLCLPSEVFVWETLGVLKLCGPSIVLKLPQSVWFPKLKALHLKNIAMQSHSDKFIFAEGYPVIEDLRLERISFPKNNKNEASLGIFLTSLLKLEIDGTGIDLCRIDINTPNLQHLITQYYFYGYYKELKLCRCESIESAHFYQATAAFGRGQLYVALLNKVNNVKDLRLAKGFAENLNGSANSLQQFPRLTNLEVTSNGETMWILLQRAPILKALVYDMECMGNYMLPQNVPLCSARNLREIKIKGFKGAEAECAAVRYFLKHAAVLEKMSVELKGCGIDELPSSILKQLLEQRRLSPNCQIEFLEWSS